MKPSTPVIIGGGASRSSCWSAADRPLNAEAHTGAGVCGDADIAEHVVGRHWPLADLAASAIREVMLGLLRPGLAPDLYVVSDGAPYAYELVVHGHRTSSTASRRSANVVASQRDYPLGRNHIGHGSAASS